MKTAALVCFILSALFYLSAINTVLGYDLSNPHIVPRCIGAFLPATFTLILALFFHWRASKRRPPTT
jgi:hypothetical protein